MGWRCKSLAVMQLMPAKDACNACNKGSFSDAEQATACKPCAAGQIQAGDSADGYQSCDDCDVSQGEYQNAQGQVACKTVATCNAGFSVTQAPTLSSDRQCTACDEGRSQPGTNQPTCDACGQGKWCNQ